MVKCPTKDCGASVSFAEKFKTFQLIHGLVDKEIQEKILAAGAALAEGQELTLAEVTKMAQAAEMGKSTHKQLSSSGMISRLSDHQKSKGAGQHKKFEKRSDGKGQCKFCDQKLHPRDDCPAKEATCNNCGLKGHFSSKCYRKKKGNTKVVKGNVKGVQGEEEASLNTVSEDFFGEVGELNQLSVSSGTGEYEFELSPRMVAKLGESEPVGHHHCDQLGRWKRGRVEPHGRVRVRVALCAEGYYQMDR